MFLTILDCIYLPIVSRLRSRRIPRPVSGPIHDHVMFPTTDYVPDRFSELFPPCSMIASRHEIVDSRPVPSTEWLPAFPSHSRSAVSKQEPFPVPSPGTTQNFFRLRRAKQYRPVPTDAFGTAQALGKNGSMMLVKKSKSCSVGYAQTILAGIKLQKTSVSYAGHSYPYLEF